MILCPLSIHLQRPDAFLLYKTCIFELKLYFFFIVTKKMPIQFTFFSNTILILVLRFAQSNQFLTQINCPVPHSTCLHFFFFFFFCSHQKKVIVNKVISILKQCLQLPLFMVFFPCIQHLYIKGKTIQFTFLSKMILYQFFAIKSINF